MDFTATPPPLPLPVRQAAKPASDGIKAVRGRLQSGSSIEPQFEIELLSMYARNEIRAAVTMPALSIIFSLSSMFWAPKYQALGWLVLVIMTKVMLLWVCGRFLADPDAANRLGYWRNRLMRIELLAGLAWGGFVMVGMDVSGVFDGSGLAQLTAIANHNDGPQSLAFSSNVFVFATLIVVLAIRMTFAATVLPILYVGTIPMTAAVVIRCR